MYTFWLITVAWFIYNFSSYLRKKKNFFKFCKKSIFFFVNTNVGIWNVFALWMKIEPIHHVYFHTTRLINLFLSVFLSERKPPKWSWPYKRCVPHVITSIMGPVLPKNPLKWDWDISYIINNENGLQIYWFSRQHWWWDNDNYQNVKSSFVLELK